MPSKIFPKNLFYRIFGSKFLRGLSNDASPMTLVLKFVVPAGVSSMTGASISLFTGYNGDYRLLYWALGFWGVGMMLALLYLAVFLAKVISDQFLITHFLVRVATPNDDGVKVTPYAECIGAVQNAKNRVLVIGGYFTRDSRIDTDSHGEYLTVGIEERLTKAKTSLDKNFQYKRIIQVGDDMHNVVLGNALRTEAIADEAMVKHVGFALKKGSEGVNVRICVRPFVPSFPSVLIVDDDRVFFSLPYARSNSSDFENDTMDFSYDFVLELTDKTSQTAQEFVKLFLQLEASESRTITKLLSPSGGSPGLTPAHGVPKPVF